MDLTEYIHTKDSFKRRIISRYLGGYSEEDISAVCETDEKTVSYIIDCYNYLNN